MPKLRTVLMAVTLSTMFLIPMTAIPKEEMLRFEENITGEQAENEIQQENKEDEHQNREEKPKAEGTFRIYDIVTETVLNVSFSDYVKGAIASEMGADFEFEALVAQGMAAFSCALNQMEARKTSDYDFSAAPEKKLGYMTEEKAREIYGSAFDEKWGIISSSAEKAMKYVITYDGAPALTVYHAISNGMTEKSGNVWNGALPYLVSVESPGDKLHSAFESTVKIGKDEAMELLNKNGAGLSGAVPEEWFKGAVLTEAGYVDRIQIGAAIFSGERIRELFGLRSTSFEVEYKNGEFVFSVRGYGHGVGLSQVGANYMAGNGSDFREIIAHYYPGTELIEYNVLYG